MNDDNSIFGYIKTQESLYKQPVKVNEAWDWSMKEHILVSELYKNSQLRDNANREFTPVKNITRPILNLQYRTEDLEVKDVQIYVDDSDKYHLSFLVKKYHDDVFSQEYDLDTFLDEVNVSRIDFGAALVKKLNHPCPEWVPLQSIAFCDQSDILSAPFGLRHYFSPDQLVKMEARGWGNPENGATISIEELLTLATPDKKVDPTSGQTNKTPGRYLEIYEIHGNLPRKFFDAGAKVTDYDTRVAIVAFYQKKDATDKTGVILYTAIENEVPFKLIKRDPVHGRALGFGGAEELFEPQVWVNYDMIRMQSMLDAASKTILATTDPLVAAKNNISNMENLDILDLAPGTDIRQVDTFPRNMALFQRSVAEWETHAQQMGSAGDAILGESPSAGTPFKLQELVTQEGHGLHDYRRGIFAKFIEEIYKDWIIPHIEKKICEGATFLSELSLEEMQYVTESLATNYTNQFIKDKILNEGMVEQEEIDAYKDLVVTEFKKKGNKHFIEILKGEFKDAGLSVKVSVKGKSKDLSKKTDALVNVFRQIIANPSVLQIPAMARIFNDILEYSGLDPADFSGITKAQLAPPQAEDLPPGSANPRSQVQQEVQPMNA